MLFSQKEKSVIYEAFDMYYADYCKTLPSNEELSYITFTKEFEVKILKLIEREKKFYFYWINTVHKRVAIIILALLIGLTSVTFSVKAMRDTVVSFIVETFERCSNLIFASDNKPNDLLVDFEFEIVTPQYIPNGFTVQSSDLSSVTYDVLYVGEDNDSIILYCQYINDGAIMQINTEKTTYEEFSVNDHAAIYYSNKGHNTIVTSGEKYIFMVQSTIPKEELIKIMESIEIK